MSVPDPHEPARSRRLSPLRIGLAIAAVIGVVGLAGVAALYVRSRGFQPTEQPSIAFPFFDPPAVDVEILPIEAPPVDLSERYEWSVLEIGGGGYVTGIETHPAGAIVARTDVGGAFVYDRDGGRWDALLGLGRVADAVPADYQVESVAIAPSDPDRMYLAGGDSDTAANGRVLVSSDGGASWQSGDQRFVIAGNVEWRTGGERLSVDPDDADIVWLGTRTEGLWRSSDGGLSFVAMGGVPDGTDYMPGFSPTGITFVEASADSVAVGVSGSGVWRSTDDGVSWTQLWDSTGLPYDAETDAAGRLWVAEPQDGRVQRFDPATSSVATFEPSGEREYASVATDPRDADLVIVTGIDSRGGDVWRTTDGGESWGGVRVEVTCAVPAWLETYASDFLSMASLEFDPVAEDRVWFPEGFGVWRADGAGDGDLEFQCDTLGIEELVANDIAVPVSGSPVTASWDRALFAHLPGGVGAAVQGPSPRFNSAWALATTPAVPGRVYAIVADHRFCCEDDGEAYWAGWSDDAGQTWERFGSYGDGNHPDELRFGNLAVSSVDPDVILWLPTFDSPLQRSLDGGATWSQVLMPGAEDRFGPDGKRAGGSHFAHFVDRHVLVADPVDGATFYLFHTELGLMATVDAGATWEQRSGDALRIGSAGAFNARLEAVPGRSGHLLFTPGPADGRELPMWESLDGGRTWEIVPGTAAAVAIGFGAPLSPDGSPAIYVAGVLDGVRGVYRSGDDLATWELLSEAPNDMYANITAVAGDPEVAGRVIVGFDGSGYVQGDHLG